MLKDNLSVHRQLSITIASLAVLLTGLYFTSWINYLLFHTLAELSSIIIAFCIFIIAWNSSPYIKNNYLMIVGVAYLFIGFIDLLHTLSYKGMPIFTDYDYYANQLWIGARYLESITLLFAVLCLNRKKLLPINIVFLGYLIVTTYLIMSVFVWKNFPECFIAGSGLTTFKKISEYVICSILLLTVFFLRKNRAHFDSNIYRIFLLSIIFTIISELAFTFYISNYGLSNLIGHYFKIFSFFTIYMAIIKTGFQDPIKLIFHDLGKANLQLREEIASRIQVQQENEGLISELQQAIKDINTLKGIIPICSKCKNIRDVKGAWNKLEAYIELHSEAQFSHGICQSCMDALYSGQEWYENRNKS